MRLTFSKLSAPIVRCLLVFVLLLAVGIAGRLLPHPPNFTPVAAAALFAGYFFRRLGVAVLVPLVIMAVSDVALGSYQLPIMLTVYGAFLFPVAIRSVLRRKVSVVRVGACATGGSLCFFLSTNFAVWLFGPWYAQSAAGLVQCYVAAVPFFKYTLAGDLLWSAVFFGAYAVVVKGLPSHSLRRRAAVCARA